MDRRAAEETGTNRWWLLFQIQGAEPFRGGNEK